jgi:hypothetical protein
MSRKFLTPIELPANPTAALEAATKQYVDGLVAGGVPDGDKGDITVAAGVWTIDALAVTGAKIAATTIVNGKLVDGTIQNAKMQDMATMTIKGNNLAAGQPRDLTLAQFAAMFSGLDAAKPAFAGVPGMQYWATDTKRLWLSDGSGWIILSEPWTNFTPTFTNMAAGNGTLIAQTQRSNGNAKVRFSLILGSTSTVGTTPQFTIPYAANNLGIELDTRAIVELYDSAGARRLGVMAASSSTLINLGYVNTNTPAGQAIYSGLTAALPFTWKANDRIRTSFEYMMLSAYS